MVLVAGHDEFTVHLPLSLDLWRRLPRHPDWRYEYMNGHAVLSPRPRPLALRRPTALPVTQARSGIEVRALDVGSDSGVVAALLADVWSREDPYRCLEDPVETLRSEIERSLDSVRFGGVAMLAGAMRAAALVHGEQEPTLTWLTVASDAREHGLATALLAHISAGLQQRGVRELASAVSGANTPSLRWHLSRDFALAADPLRETQRFGPRDGPERPSHGAVWGTGDLRQADQESLVDLLYDLRCAVAAAAWGEPPFLTAEQYARAQARIAELEPLVGAELDRRLAAED